MFPVTARNQQDYAYRQVCKSGAIQPLQFDQIEQFRDRAADYTQDFLKTNLDLRDGGVSFDRIMAGKGESVIMLSSAADAEAALDVLYHVPKLERKTKSSIVQDNNSIDLRAMMLNAFDTAVAARAEMRPLTPAFAAATRSGDNDNVARPAFAAQEMRLAA